MLDKGTVFGLASAIDAERASELAAGFGGNFAAALATLLGTAYPALTPSLPWQEQALHDIASRGLLRRKGRRTTFAHLERSTRNSVDFADALRRGAWAEKARIALRELIPRHLGGPDVDETARELSHLADAVIELALLEAEAAAEVRFGTPVRHDGKRSRLVIYGMGKLGGQELNSGSDVDLILVYDTDDGGSSVSLHEHWSYVGRRVVQSIEAPTASGSIFRVDLRLRPEGAKGPLVNSVVAIERYYETWGRLWERAAWLRGRPVAGDLELGGALQREIFSPFVYRSVVEPAIAAALAELIDRARLEQGKGAERDLKIGVGGIREAEFFVQSLQLIWGGQQESLRIANTLRALYRLSSRGLVKAKEAEDIEQGYLLLRRVEHRVQWSTGIQTHRLPEGAPELERLSRSLWYPSVEQFQAELAKARARINELFLSLLPGAKYPVSPYTKLLSQLERSESAEAESQPEGADVHATELALHLRALARRPDGLLGELTRERYPGLIDAVLVAIQESTYPIQAARFLRGYFGKFVSASAAVGPLANDPPALSRFVNILGASAFVGEALVARPDLAELILFGAGQLARVNPTEIVDHELEIFEHERASSGELEAYEVRDLFMAALRRAKGKVTVDVAAADLAGLLEPRDVTRLLSALADQVLERALCFELGGSARGMCIIAVGKLGGSDIGYGSDLDVIFIYDPASAPSGTFAPEYYGRVAQRVIHIISDAHSAGPGYELDTRLRPSGSKGLLVTSLEAFARYHRIPFAGTAPTQEPQVLTSGAAWERQALLRARYAAGDADLGFALIQLAHIAAYERGAPEVEEMHRLRLRMQQELVHEWKGHYDLKLGRGGILDVEFTCQWLQMRHGLERRVRTTDTLTALAALRSTEHLSEEDYIVLSDGYGFLRALEQRLRVATGKGGSVIDSAQEGFEHLARRMGFRDMPTISAAELLVGHYKSVADSIRATYLRVLGLRE